MPSLTESMGQRLQIGIHDIGLSLVNDIKCYEVLYISLNKSKVVWTETKKSRVRPLSHEVNLHLEELYKTHTEQREANPDDKALLNKRYHMDQFQVGVSFIPPTSRFPSCGKQEISFQGDVAELTNTKGQRKLAKRQALDGLWIEYAWSVTNSALHIRLNRVQIDNQLEYAIFPVVLYPIISRATGTDLAEKPFIELSVYESKTTRSNVMHFKYFKLLVQEFAVKVDQGLIVAILALLREQEVRLRIERVH